MSSIFIPALIESNQINNIQKRTTSITAVSSKVFDFQVRMNVNITTLKISLIIIIFFSGVFGVLSPRLFKPFGSRLAYASLLSSGVLLSAALVHLLGDAADGISESSPLPKTADGDAYPWAYFFCGASFYFLYFFERFALHSLSHKKKNNNNELRTLPSNLKTPLIHNSDNPTAVSNALTPAAASKNGYDDPTEDDDVREDEHGNEIFELMQSKNYLTGIVLLIGLGLHSFLAGVALGSSQEVQTFNLNTPHTHTHTTEHLDK